MPVRFDAWSAATWTALWTRPWSKHSDGDRLRGRSLRRSVGGFLGQEEVKRLAGRRPFGNHRFVDPTSFHIIVGRVDGETVAAAIALDFEGDCGIYNVGTLEHARRRGLGTAVTAFHLHQARARGCRTATLQSTERAERLYGSVGFRDLGLILEYAP